VLEMILIITIDYSMKPEHRPVQIGRSSRGEYRNDRFFTKVLAFKNNDKGTIIIIKTQLKSL
jgi:hypothetical protein